MFNTQAANNVGSEAKNKVLSQTYKLLSFSIIWSGICAIISMFAGVPPMGTVGAIVFLVVYFGLLFAIEKNRYTATGVYLVFALTGILGVTLAPMLSMLIGAGKGGLIATALLGTGGVFLIASQIGKDSSKDFSGMARIVFPVLIMGFIAGLVNAFVFKSPIMANIISVIFLVCSSFVITWQVNQIVKGGEDSYISATVTLYVSLYNIFSSLLQLLMAGSDD